MSNVDALIGTHCWLWLQAEPERLAEATLEVSASRHNEILLSAASAREIAIEYGLGELTLPEAPEEYVPSRMLQSSTTALPVTHIHALRVAALPAASSRSVRPAADSASAD